MKHSDLTVIVVVLVLGFGSINYWLWKIEAHTDNAAYSVNSIDYVIEQWHKYNRYGE